MENGTWSTMPISSCSTRVGRCVTPVACSIFSVSWLRISAGPDDRQREDRQRDDADADHLAVRDLVLGSVAVAVLIVV